MSRFGVRDVEHVVGFDPRDAEIERLRAEVGRLTAERRADELAVKLDGAIVVRDDEATRERIARACFEFDRGETWSERTNSDEKTYTEEADAVLAALREVYQRGEQDSRGDPTPCLHPDSIEERQNATDAAQEGGAK